MSPSDPIEFGEKKAMSIGLVVWFIIITAISVATVTTVYHRFVFVEGEIGVLSNRVDKRYDRMKIELLELKDEIDKKVEKEDEE